MIAIPHTFGSHCGWSGMTGINTMYSLTIPLSERGLMIGPWRRPKRGRYRRRRG